MTQTLPIFHTVSLRQAQARRAEGPPQPVPADPEPGFEDTVPLWFRSEAFAEDIEHDHSPPAGAHRPRRMDAHVLAAGAAVLRMTLAALRAASQPPVPPLTPLHRSPRRASGWV